MEKKQLPKLPFSVGDRAAFIRKATVALKLVNVPTYEVLTYSIAYNRVEVIHVPASGIATHHTTKGQYYVDGEHISGGTAAQAKIHLAWLREQALRGGATPDAIRLLGAIKPFSKKEVADMAEKLKSKSAAKADKDGLKSAAKKAPVAKKSGGGKRGNPEALAKARAARSSGPDTRKITTLKKAKDIGAREGSYRHTMLTDLLSSKTVQEFRDKNSKYSAGDLRYAESAGYIKLPAKA